LLVVGKLIGVAVAAFGTVAICNSAEVQGTPLGLPLAGVLVVIFLVVLTFLAKRTTFGRHVYAVGGNAEAARRAGINVPRIRVLVFMISSGMAAVGGIILSANVSSVSLSFGGGELLLDAIAAAVIGASASSAAAARCGPHSSARSCSQRSRTGSTRPATRAESSTS
jgi:D-xylose transport system permease protein